MAASAATDVDSTIAGASSGVDSRMAAMCTAVTVWLLSSLLVAWFEFSIFWNLPLLLFTMNLSISDQTLVVWSLWARTLLVTLPAIVVIAASLWTKRAGAFRMAAWMAHWLMLVWLIIDVGLQCVTGASAWHYVEKAWMTEDLSLGGDVSAVTEGVQAAVLTMALRVCGLFVVCHFLFHSLHKQRQRDLRPVALALSCAAAVVVFGILGARSLVQQPAALEQLYGSMALRAWAFHPDRITEYGTAAFGTACDEEFAAAGRQLNAVCQPCHPDLLNDEESLSTANSSSEVTRVAVNSVHVERLFDASALGTQPPGLANTNDYFARPHVVVLLTESIRFDAFDAQHAPKLASWMDRCLVADNHNTNSNCSELGAFASVYSRYPLSYNSTLDSQVPAEPFLRLKQLGYNRQLITSCSVNFCRMQEFLGPLNFDRTSIHAPRGNPWHDNDRRTLAEITQLLQTSDQPQLVFSILMSTHYDYDYPASYDQQPPACVPPLSANPATADRLRDRYWKAVAYLDEQLDQFLTAAAETNTIVVITGDHGESFLDDGFLCHGTRLSDIQARTPLLIFGPQVVPTRFSWSSSHVDLMPTLLDLAGDSRPLKTSHGQSLLTVQHERDQILTMAHTHDWDVLLMSSEGRLGVQLPISGDRLKVLGFFDECGRVDLQQRKTAADIGVWANRLEAALPPVETR